MQDLPPWEPKRIIESETRFVWDGHTVLHELSSDEGLTTWYWEPGTFTPVAKERGKQFWSLVHDHLGTPTEMYDVQGQLVWQMELDSFGKPTFGVGDATDCPWRWPGQYEDQETGLNYNHWRYFSSALGAYLASDPLGLEGGLREYGYVRDTLTLFDVLGLLERFFRYVSEAEARQSAGNLGGDNQLHPRTHKNRRGGVTESRGPKWITQEGSPRRGPRSSTWRLDIEAEDGTRAWLNQRGIDFDDVVGPESSVPDRVILKTDEPGSFGVGRNLLGQLNARIRRITGPQGGGRRASNRGRRNPGTRGGC